MVGDAALASRRKGRAVPNRPLVSLNNGDGADRLRLPLLASGPSHQEGEGEGINSIGKQTILGNITEEEPGTNQMSCCCAQIH